MTKPIAANYGSAQRLIEAGRWQVDPDMGVIRGVRGRPFRRMNSWGYIQIKFRDTQNWRVDRAVLAHRVIWEYVHGPLADGLQINHMNGVKTDNRTVNLEAVTGSANIAHAFATGLNHPHRANARLSPEQVAAVYQRCLDGERDDALAAEFGVNRSTVNNIRNGWNWRHITGHQPSGRGRRPGCGVPTLTDG